MLSREHRLVKTRDFVAMGKKGRAVFSPFMTLRVRTVAFGGPKIGFVTPVKSMKKAVDRNRAKRIMRHIVRDLMPEVPRDVHLVLLLKPTILGAPHEELVAETRRVLSKIPEALVKPATISPRERKMREKRAKRAPA